MTIGLVFWDMELFQEKKNKIMETQISYTVTHIGNGEFSVELQDGTIKSAGSNLCGMIRYTYFEDYSLPEVGWKVTSKKLMEDYVPKMHKDVLSGNQIK